MEMSNSNKKKYSLVLLTSKGGSRRRLRGGVRAAALTARYLLGGRRVDRGDQVSLRVGLIVQRRTRRAQTGILVQPQHLCKLK